MTTWVPAKRVRNFRQQWEMLNRRLAYPGGRKARSAERRIQRLMGPMQPFLRGVTMELRTVKALLAGVGAAVPRQGLGTEGSNGQ